MSKRLIILAIAVLFIASIGFLVIQKRSGPNQEKAEDTVQPRLVPDLTLQDYQKKQVKLIDFKGKSLLLNTWASWCPFCQKELPDFVTAQKEFGDQVLIVVINRAESLEIAKEYSDQLGVTNELVLLLDPEDSFYQAMGGFSMPETLFIDRDGFIKAHKRGLMELEEIRRRIEELIGAGNT